MRWIQLTWVTAEGPAFKVYTARTVHDLVGVWGLVVGGWGGGTIKIQIGGAICVPTTLGPQSITPPPPAIKSPTSCI